MSVTREEMFAKALELGWDDMGITSATIPEDDIAAYLEWLQLGYQADLTYMENQVRCSPQALLPGAKSAVIFVSHYKQEKVPFRSDKGVIASYARGRDYHHVHRKRLRKFIQWLEETTGQKNCAKGFSDSTPVLEKALAVQAGLGWFGKNTLLIHRKFGTFTLLAGLFTTLEISHTSLSMRQPRCGTCTRCLEACPTQAFVSPYRLDAARCLSYHLIESKQAIPKEMAQVNPGYVFGCDICQDVCPHNVKPLVSKTPEFAPSAGNGGYLGDEELSLLKLKPEILHGTPLQRRGVSGLQYNLDSINSL